MTEPNPPLVVVKIGGSLFDHPALGPGLRRWLAEQPTGRYLFVPGGGALADCIRNFHRLHGIDEDACHWLAIDTMTLNARLLQLLVEDCPEVNDPAAAAPNRRSVLNASAFCRQDDAQPDALPHDWRVTSDAIAARAAEIAGASRLILLKSTDLPGGIRWAEAAERGLVDPMFPQVVERSGLVVHWINFRALVE
jgi:5-(aminomethyl)-3-furanmethanol phosphate kinase